MNGRDEIEARLREFIRSDLMQNPAYPLRDDEPLVTGGLIDSFMLAHLAVFVEQAFGVVLPDVVLASGEVDTIERLADRIRRDQPC